MPSPTGPERLRELSRQIKNLAQRCCAASRLRRWYGGWRCAPDSLWHLVYIFSGHCSNRQLTSGRGWRRSWLLQTEESLPVGLTFACPRRFRRFLWIWNWSRSRWLASGMSIARQSMSSNTVLWLTWRCRIQSTVLRSCADGRCGGAAVCERAPWRLGTRYAAEGAEVLGGLSPQMERKVWVPARRRLH